MYVERAMYSLRMSFCTVPRRSRRAAPWPPATATYSARRIDAVALIVMLVLPRACGGGAAGRGGGAPAPPPRGGGAPAAPPPPPPRAGDNVVVRVVPHLRRE